jgi:hypothetical protein
MHAIYHYMYIEVLCLNYGTVVVKLYFLPPPKNLFVTQSYKIEHEDIVLFKIFSHMIKLLLIYSFLLNCS